MKNLLILCLHRPDRSPSQRFRFEQYLPYLEAHGYQIDYSYLLNEEQDKIYYKPGNYVGKLRIVLGSVLKRLSEVLRAKKYDVVLVQREAFMLGTAFFERAIGARVPMIFDFDDSIWLQVVSESNQKLAFLKDASKTAHIIEKSALVFAGNEFLASYARQFNDKVVIVPTTIDTSVYRRLPKSTDDNRVCIGWSGSFSTIEHFSTAIPALKAIREKYGDERVRFKVVGDPTYYCKELDTKGEAWTSKGEVQLLSDMDIGIMPLPDTEWAKGKCGLKGLQYMALGIPTLMSPVGVNTEIIRDGENGYLPRTDAGWIERLSELVESAEMRARIGDAGRRTVEEHYSTKAWEEKYCTYFDQLTSKQ
jgi:glycosyltransferase involved in cell wall biosynthesis